jgi:hypothetical protein
VHAKTHAKPARTKVHDGVLHNADIPTCFLGKSPHPDEMADMGLLPAVWLQASESVYIGKVEEHSGD